MFKVFLYVLTERADKGGSYYWLQKWTWETKGDKKVTGWEKNGREKEMETRNSCGKQGESFKKYVRVGITNKTRRRHCNTEWCS